MKLSTRGRYALRAMVDLSHLQGNKTKPISLREISLRQDISLTYLEQLFNKLKKACLVNSVRGVEGGYLLAREADQISAADIIRAVEGPILLVDCIFEDSRNKKKAMERCKKSDDCLTKSLWEEITCKINQILEKKSLKDLCTTIPEGKGYKPDEG